MIVVARAEAESGVTVGRVLAEGPIQSHDLMLHLGWNDKMIVNSSWVRPASLD